MKSSLVARTLLLLVLPMAAGCLEVEEHLTINKDGSSLTRVELSITKARLEGIRRMAEMRGGSGGPDEMFDEKRFKEKVEGAGAKVESFKVVEADEKKGLIASYSAKDLATLNKLGLSGGGESEMLFYKGAKEGTVRLVIFPKGRRHQEEAARQLKQFEENENTDEGKRAAEFQKQFMEKLKEDVKGLKASFRFTVPGRIESISEGLEVEKDNITARFTFTDADLTDPKRAMRVDAARFEIVFTAIDGFSIPVVEDKGESRKSSDEGKGEDAKETGGKGVEEARARKRDKGEIR